MMKKTVYVFLTVLDVCILIVFMMDPGFLIKLGTARTLVKDSGAHPNSSQTTVASLIHRPFNRGDIKCHARGAISFCPPRPMEKLPGSSGEGHEVAEVINQGEDQVTQGVGILKEQN